MDTINIGLPAEMREFVENLVSTGQYANTDDYVRSLIQADQERHVKDSLEAEVLKGLHSGPPVPMTPEDWASIRGEVRSRHSRS